MHTLILVALTLLAAQQAYTPTAASAPSTDIYLGRLVYDSAPDNTAEVVAIDGLVNITNHDGYDNQPAFRPDGTLQVGDLRTSSVETIAENPGRSLHKVPGRRAVSFVRKIADGGAPRGPEARDAAGAPATCSGRAAGVSHFVTTAGSG